MSEKKRFSRDLIIYQLGAILPGLNNFLIIFILKRFLSPVHFGYYSIRMGFLTLVSIASIGWISQGVIRFTKAEEQNKIKLLKASIILSSCILGVIGFFATIVLSFFYNDSLLISILLSLGALSSGLQLILVSYSQANFNSKNYLFGEVFRTGIYLSLSFFIVWVVKENTTSFLFAAFIISNFIGIIFLLKKNSTTIGELIRLDTKNYLVPYFRKLFKYGGPLILWFFIWNIMNYIEKPLLLKYTQDYGKVGHYQAVYEIITKGASLLLFPISYAIFPHVTESYENQEFYRTRQLIKKVILLELLLLIGALIIFPAFGFKIIVFLFNIPNQSDYFYTSLIILMGVFIWQASIILHKPMELDKKTPTMVWGLGYSFIIYLILLFSLPILFPGNLIVYPIPMLISGLFYTLFIVTRLRNTITWKL